MAIERVGWSKGCAGAAYARMRDGSLPPAAQELERAI